MTVQRAVVALAVVGLCRTAYFYFVSEPNQPRRDPIDARYAAARALLPSSGEIGYVSDLRPSTGIDEDAASPGTRLYLHAQYALAPLVLRNGDARAATVLVNVSQPATLAEVLDRNRLHLVAETGRGVAVAAPR